MDQLLSRGSEVTQTVEPDDLSLYPPKETLEEQPPRDEVTVAQNSSNADPPGTIAQDAVCYPQREHHPPDRLTY